MSGGQCCRWHRAEEKVRKMLGHRGEKTGSRSSLVEELRHGSCLPETWRRGACCQGAEDGHHIRMREDASTRGTDRDIDDDDDDDEDEDDGRGDRE